MVYILCWFEIVFKLSKHFGWVIFVSRCSPYKVIVHFEGRVTHPVKNCTNLSFIGIVSICTIKGKFNFGLEDLELCIKALCRPIKHRRYKRQGMDFLRCFITRHC